MIITVRKLWIAAITLYPFIIIKSIYYSRAYGKYIINHEKIHLHQQLEMLIIPFYLWYLIEYLIKLFYYGNHRDAYMTISFEQEAYRNELNIDYLKTRKAYSWIKYLRNK